MTQPLLMGRDGATPRTPLAAARAGVELAIEMIRAIPAAGGHG